MKVKTITTSSLEELENKVNDFLSLNREARSVDYSTYKDEEDHIVFVAFICYYEILTD